MLPFRFNFYKHTYLNIFLTSRSFDAFGATFSNKFTATDVPLTRAATATNKIVSYHLNVIFVIEFSVRGREAPRHKHRELVILPALR